MGKNRICAAIVDSDVDAVEKISSVVDIFEVRIDLIGESWRDIVKRIQKPWMATCRRGEDKGRWTGGEKERIHLLMDAMDLGADIVDIEINTQGLNEIVSTIKKKAACLVSYHNFEYTPEHTTLINTVNDELAAGADICKVVTTAKSFEDTISVLRLISEFKKHKITAFTMGDQGMVSRILCPILGGYLTYSSVQSGKESAPGQITAADLAAMFELVEGK
jgi:3-dehydroquinate dehydratase I